MTTAVWAIGQADSGHLAQGLADRQAFAVEQVAVSGIEGQFQRLAIARREIAADAHGQRLARLGEDVAVGVAAQAFADVGLDLQLAAAVGAAVEVLGADTERYRIAEGQGRAAQRQLQAAPGVQLYLAALGMYA